MDGEYLELQGTALEELSKALLVEQDALAATRAELSQKSRELADLRRELQDLRAWNSIGASPARKSSTAEFSIDALRRPLSAAPSPIRREDACVGRSRVSEERDFREIAVGDSRGTPRELADAAVSASLQLSPRTAPGTPGAGYRGEQSGAVDPGDAAELGSLRAQNALLEAQVRALRRQALQAGTAVRILSAGFASSLSAFVDLAARIAGVSRRVRRVDASVGRLLRLQRMRRREPPR